MVTADDVRVAGELGALLDRDSLPKIWLKFHSKRRNGLRVVNGSDLESLVAGAGLADWTLQEMVQLGSANESIGN